MTEADHLSEPLILDAIRSTLPGDGMLAEESGGHAAASGAAATDKHGRVWVIDPLDGTVNYANGIPFFCVSIGLVVDGRPVGRRRPRPDPRRDVRRRRSTVRRSSSTTAPRGPDHHRVREGQALRLRRVARPRRPGGGDAHPGRPQGRPDQPVDGRGRARRWPTSRTAGSTRSSSRAGCPPGTSRPAGLIAERAGATVTDMNGGPWFDLGQAEQHDRPVRRAGRPITRRSAGARAARDSLRPVAVPAMRPVAQPVEARARRRTPPRPPGRRRPSAARRPTAGAGTRRGAAGPASGTARPRRAARRSAAASGDRAPDARARPRPTPWPGCRRSSPSGRGRRRPTSSPSRGCPDSRRRCRRRGRGSPGSTSAATPHFARTPASS